MKKKFTPPKRYRSSGREYFMLNFNGFMIVDFNKDFIADHILTPDGKK